MLLSRHGTPVRPQQSAATREAIIDRTYRLVRNEGFEGISIGAVASLVGMSKSGVFAHFGSREDLQLAVLDATAQRFAENVFRPALREKRGLPRLRAVMLGALDWMSGEIGGCPMLSAAMEFDDRPGPVRDAVIGWQRRFRSELAKTIRMAVETGELNADTDAEQLAFEFFAIEIAVHHDAHLFGSKPAVARGITALDRLLSSARSPQS